MKYISLFSGIEAASVAWSPLGWEPLAFSEIAPFPSAVLAARFPDVPNLGDITSIDWSSYKGSADVVVGGSPCFPAGTPVLTRDGSRPIESVHPGDMVLTHMGRWRRVVSTGSHEDDTIALHGANLPERIECTANHPFLSRNAEGSTEWVRADDMLGRECLLMDADAKDGSASSDSIGMPHRSGRWATVESISPSRKDVIVYNMEVEDDHSYTAWGVAVHNCQSFSIAGKREGLSGASGLMFEYIRAVRDIRPRWFVWENVPGALSSEHGAAFGQLISQMDELGYGLAWRILDAQFFGVAQRRRRLFLVGHLGDLRSGEVLIEPEGLRGDSPSSRDKRKDLAARAREGASAAGRTDGTLTPWDTQGRRIYGDGGAWPTLDARDGRAGANAQAVYHPPVDGVSTGDGRALTPWDNQTDRIYPVDGPAPTPSMSHGQGGNHGPNVFNPSAQPESTDDKSASESADDTEYEIAGNIIGRIPPNGGNGPGFCNPDDIGAYTLTAADRHAVFTQYGHDLAGTLTARFDSSPCVDRGQNIVVPDDSASKADDDDAKSVAEPIRRLTPVECERLQGFPDGWTDVPYRGRDHAADSPRYVALGNSMAVPVMHWIGRRIQLVDDGVNPND